MTNEEIIAEIKAGRDTADNLLQLYIQNHGIIYRWCKPLSNTFDMADLMQEAFLALHDAVMGYNEREDANFLYFFRFMMLNHFRSLRRSSADLSIPDSLHDAIRQYKKMRDAYIVTLGKEPSDKVYCQALRISYKELSAIRANLNPKARSLSDPVLSFEGDEVLLEETIADKNSGIDAALDRIEQEELKEILDKMLSALPENQSNVLKMRFSDGLTLKECAERSGVYPETVRQTEIKALNGLRNQSENMKSLREFVDDADIYDMGMIRRGLSTFRSTLESTTETAAFNLMRYREKLSERAAAYNRHIDEISSFFRSDERLTVSS